MTTKKTNDDRRGARRRIGIWRRRLHRFEREYLEAKDGTVAEALARSRMDTAYSVVMRLMSAEEKHSANHNQ
jgi:hypothetical protein